MSVRKMVYTALLIALGTVLPIMLHTVPNAGMVLLPMHIPILLCGLICGIPYGLICGIATPLLSHFFTGMPPAFILPQMLCELAAYGAGAAICIRYVNTRNLFADIYIALIGAMMIGRVIFGVANMLFFNTGEYTLQIWLTAAFVTALPGIIIQIILIPAIVVGLQKARLIEL